ncbi:MAG: glycine--tRNA ligase subunit beta [bacterium]
MAKEASIIKEDFLLELWVEEIPSGYITHALTCLKKYICDSLDNHKVNYKSAYTYGTPNRLVVYIEKVAVFSEKETKEVYGPSEKMLLDDNKQFTIQAQGFAKKFNIKPEHIKIKDGRGVVSITSGNEKTRTILARVLPELILKIEFPKTMVWEQTQFRFARPIRNIVALLGKDVVHFRVAGVKSSKKTLGLHVYSEKFIIINNPQQYAQKLKDNCVIVDPVKRKEAIIKLAQQSLKNYNANISYDETLIEEICFLVEHPVAIVGSFNKEFLDLPGIVLISCLKDKQKFLTVVDKAGKLLPYFVGFRNGVSEHQDIVREGYEKVVEARLRDVKFFFEKDKQTKLEERVEKLHAVVQNEQLGSLHQKVSRIMVLAGGIAQELKLSQNEQSMLQRAVKLCKTDLITEMVFEYPELQGIIGGIYAGLDGEAPEVAQAISQHYRPLQMGEPLPENIIGKILAIADKIDSLNSSFVLGYIPKGSGDPYGLRRMALGIINIALENNFEISIQSILNKSIELFPEELHEKNMDALANALDFIKQRLSVQFSSLGFSYDTVDAILSSPGWGKSLVNTKVRLQALKEIRSHQNFEPFIILYKRAANILRQASEMKLEFEGDCDPKLFKQKEETDLWERCSNLEKTYFDCLNKREYNKLFFALLEFKDPLNSFFDKVMVMVDAEALKINRLKLIKKFNSYFAPLADFSKIGN